MRKITVWMTVAVLLSASGALAADAPKAQSARIKQTAGQIKAARTDSVVEHAKELIDAAQTSIEAAQAAEVAGNDVQAARLADKAGLQMLLAEVKTSEKKLLEKVAVSRVELKKLEAQLEKYRQGEGL